MYVFFCVVKSRKIVRKKTCCEKKETEHIFCPQLSKEDNLCRKWFKSFAKHIGNNYEDPYEVNAPQLVCREILKDNFIAIAENSKQT